MSAQADPLSGSCGLPSIVFLPACDRERVPELRPGDIVVMDNLSSHKGPDVRLAIEAAGA